jgi:40-residue YVTN family beta-propeller repeat
MRIFKFTMLLVLWYAPALTAQKYAVTERIPFSGDQTYWDYLVADSPNGRLYLTRENEVTILDLNSGKEIANIPNLKRVHGIALANDLGKGFLSDGGDNAVVAFDLKTNAARQKIKVGNAPDAILYEPTKKRVYAFNAHSHNVSIIDAESEHVVATVPLPGLPEFAATDGKGNVYVNIESKNSLVRFASDGLSVRDEWPLSSCKEPAGLAIDTQGRRLFSVCANKVMIVTDADSGKQVAKVPVGVEPDAAIFDAEKKLIFSSNCDGTLTVVKQDTPDKYTVVQNLVTQREARTMALDPASHRLYLPYEEVKPGQKPTPPGDLPEFTPGTFKLMIVSPQR